MKKLWIGLIVALLAFAALAAHAETGYIEYRNPLYPDAVLKRAAEAGQGRKGASRSAGEEYTTVADAGVYLRGLMEQRTETVALNIASGERDARTLIDSIFEEALAHTGDPRGGDYLRWDFAGYSCRYGTYEEDGVLHYEFTFTVTYYTTAAQEEEMDAAVSSLMAELDLGGKSDHDKICAIYDYITSNVVYDYENLYDESYDLKYSSYAALVNGTAVCQGYSGLFYRLPLEAGVDARVVTGLGGGEAHAWNMVRIGGAYYLLDSTWDAGTTEYEYFLKGSGDFPDHTPQEEFLSDYAVSETDYAPPSVVAEGECGEGLVWTLDAENTLTVSGSGQMTDYSSMVPAPWGTDIREAVIGDGVTSIGNWAFAECAGLVSVSIARSVESVGQTAFIDCSSLQTVVLPAGLNRLGYGAFRGCTALTAIELPEGLAEVPGSAFSECSSLTRITIPDGVNAIGEGAFSNCGSLREVDLGCVETIGMNAFQGCGFGSIRIPDTVKTIGDGAFLSSKLSEVTVPGSVEDLGNGAFSSCYSLKRADIQAGIGTIRENLFRDCLELESVVIPATVKEIGYCAFDGCRALREIDLPEGLETVGRNAFFGCLEVRSVHIPAGLRSMEGSSLGHMPNLSTITVDAGNAVFESRDGVLIDTVTGTLVRYPTLKPGSVYMIPNDVRHVAPYAFYCCEYLEGAFVPDSVRDIGELAFTGTSLRSIRLSESMTTIDVQTFFDCFALSTVTIPKSVTTIAGSAFEYCDSLSTIVYSGTREDWDAITVSYGNEALASATVYYEQNSTCYALGHTEETDEGYSPSCTEDGLTEGKHCAVCGEILIAQEIIPAAGHTEEADEAVEPTCTQTGLTEGIHCAVCGEVLIAQEIIPAAGHTEETDEAAEPTCTETGLTEGVHCSVCGEILVPQEVIPAEGHREVTDAAKDPTCTQTGLTEGVHCSVCGEVLVPQEVIPAEGHREVTDAAKDPTCTETGLTEGVHCAVCGEILVRQDVVPAKGHREVKDAAKDPTCTQTGLTEGVRCSVCGEILVPQETVPAAGHTEEIDPAKDPTCTQPGVTQGAHCAVCGEVLVPQETVPALGHDWHAVYDADEAAGTVTAHRTCGHDASHTETETRRAAFVTLPAGLTAVEAEAFRSAAFTAVIIPDGVTEIGDYAFADIPGLMYVRIPAGVTAISPSAFDGSGDVWIDRAA